MVFRQQQAKGGVDPSLFGIRSAVPPPPGRRVHFNASQVPPDVNAPAADTQLSYVCAACSIQNCMKPAYMRQAITNYRTLEHRDDLRLFKHHVSEGARLTHMRSTALFRAKNVTYAEIRKAADKGTWENPQWMAPLARVRSLRSAYTALKSNDITEHQFLQQLDDAFALLQRTIELDYRHPRQASDALSFQLEWYARMDNDGLSAADAYAQLNHDNTERHVFEAPMDRVESPPPPTPAAAPEKKKRKKPKPAPLTELVSAKDRKAAPYDHWRRPKTIPEGWASKVYQGCQICKFFNWGTCYRKFATCNFVHECFSCHEIGHASKVCPASE